MKQLIDSNVIHVILTKEGIFYTMKLRTRLLITFLTIFVLPLTLTGIAFTTIGTLLVKQVQSTYGMESIDSTALLNASEEFDVEIHAMSDKIHTQIEEDAALLEDITYPERLNQEANEISSFILVRKADDIYYVKNAQMVQELYGRLPGYGAGDNGSEPGYYYNDLRKLVQQADFTFQDGTPASIFLITGVHTLISKSLLIDMVVAIVLILLFTSLMLTRWIQKGVFEPIKELNIAMQKIAEGNLSYSLQSENEDEIGSLYKNYEDMRLRLKESTEEKIAAEKKNKELISNISHDLKTPITAIKGYMEGIMDGVADTPEKMDKYIRTVYNKANDMDRLINELTLYSGIDCNRIPYHFHKINVSEYFNDCIEEIGLDMESKGIQLNYSNLVDNATAVIADPEQMKRVINNIIGNSMKYMDKKQGIIDIRILDELDSIRVEIEDNGKGIAAKDLGSIFERFYRTDASRNSSQGGSGIGLSIVKKIIEDHGGYIWATSKENEGTCLHFVLRKYKEKSDEQDIDY